MFERDDWTLFRSLNTLGQKSGVPVRNLPKLVVKELTDNALDSGGEVFLFQDDASERMIIEDSGPGIFPPKMNSDDRAAWLCRLFSINRPLISSKVLRKPTRGALGNGLRVVSGAVFATGGQLIVESEGMGFDLSPQTDGTTILKRPPFPSTKVSSGTRITISLPNDGRFQGDPLSWGQASIGFAGTGKIYSGKTSAHWYDTSSFLEMVRSANGMTLRELASEFRCGASVDLSRFPETCSELASSALRVRDFMIALRTAEAPQSPLVLGRIGRLEGMGYAYENGFTNHGSPDPAKVPFAIECYCQILPGGSDDAVIFLVNRTLIVGDFSIQRRKAHEVAVFGCGIRHLFPVGRKPVQLIINITTPYMPITTDGKEPDLHHFIYPISSCIKKGISSAKRVDRKENGPELSQKQIISMCLTDAIAKASGGGRYRYSLRQLFYGVRPYVLERLEKEPDYNYFAQMITDIEAEMGDDLPGLYRDARGVIYHPHTGEEIPLGTLNVEQYERPAWTFNKILYSEKEGFFSILKDAGWPERNDCALMTSKGFASRAARDVLDLIGNSQEEIYFFCIHDADASGTMIYQALTEATKARGARKVHVVNLGLEPWEASSMGLQIETFSKGGRERELPVADYVEDEWREWLQTRRVELNAMTSPQFLEWLDEKFSSHASKIIPPKAVLSDTLEVASEQAIRAKLASKMLDEAGFERRVSLILEELKTHDNSAGLEAKVSHWLEGNPTDRWDRPVKEIAKEIAEKALN